MPLLPLIGIAVVELFTSEGCSSCPPADALLNELARQPHVFALAFHVDYWNRLGWPDPFSNPKFSDRQRTYSPDIYTPQMIVNGREAFVGSDRSRVTRAIEAAQKQLAPVAINLRWHSSSVEYKVTGAPKDVWLHLAVIESGIRQKVPRGENAGKTLLHDNVVREFVSVRLRSQTGRCDLATTRGRELIGFVQSSSTRLVLGAARCKFEP